MCVKKTLHRIHNDKKKEIDALILNNLLKIK